MVRNIITSSSEKREMNKQKAKHHFQELWFTHIIKKKTTSEHHTVGIYGEIGNNKNFSKAQILIIWSKLLKNLPSVKQDWSIWGWSDAFAALKLERNDAVFKIFANFN